MLQLVTGQIFRLQSSIMCVLQVIYMARNPKDLVVSYYQFHRSLRTMSYRGTFQEFCRRFMNDKCTFLNLWMEISAGVTLSCVSRVFLCPRVSPQWDTAPGLNTCKSSGNTAWTQTSFFWSMKTCTRWVLASSRPCSSCLDHQWRHI